MWLCEGVASSVFRMPLTLCQPSRRALISLAGDEKAVGSFDNVVRLRMLQGVWGMRVSSIHSFLLLSSISLFRQLSQSLS